MKKAFILGCTMLFCFNKLTAQFSVDLETGLNFFKYKEINNSISYSKNIYYGINPNYNLKKKWNFGFGVQYSKNFINFTQMFDYQLDILDLVPKVAYRWNKNMDLYTGIKFGLTLNEKSKLHDELIWKNSRQNVVTTRFYSFLVGLNYHFDNFFLNINYNYGLEKLVKTTDFARLPIFIGSNVEFRLNEYNYQHFQIGIGYRLNFTKK